MCPISCADPWGKQCIGLCLWSPSLSHQGMHAPERQQNQRFCTCAGGSSNRIKWESRNS
ncbi:LOW QUALITY PROTEIN: hypothetical protein BRADI_5g05692v3 [Brachypodium distachyon]|uniref:Uncharacterized protein n=1 Tax=Brachypodium distachyon TaxID=15368 RepID=A0A0Q3H1Y6_BRADI|nr:LOW QUALITY PROTEIN: hypothetical protein BRADI_5g05692v3 [Brachypodium distachyon]